MSANSKIAWTHHTFNPWWGCTKVSPACDFCYAERDSLWWGFDVFGPDKARRFFTQKHWIEPLKWDKEAALAGQRHRVFCASMADVFESRSDLAIHRLRLWQLIHSTPNLDWLILTKRPENVAELMPYEIPPNIWLGFTVENARCMQRVEWWEHLPREAFKIFFLSIEPMLDDLWKTPGHLHSLANWLIVGAESGPHRRPTHLDWVRKVVDYGRARNVPVFIKQLDLDGRLSKDPAEWPEDLRVQQFPLATGN